MKKVVDDRPDLPGELYDEDHINESDDVNRINIKVSNEETCTTTPKDCPF